MIDIFMIICTQINVLKEDADLNQGEFYGANEYNNISEYKHFPAETYRKLQEENQCGKEDASLGNETTSLQPKPKKTKRNDGTNEAVDKIFSSLRGAATAVTVVAASVVVTTAIVTSTPKAELLSYECGDTYVEYEMQLSDLSSGCEYAIVLGSQDGEEIEKEVDDDGIYRDRIEGLKPECEYTLAFIQYDTVLGEIRHFEVKLQTIKHKDQDPIPPPPTPNVVLTDVEIVGINEVKIYFTHSDIPTGASVELDMIFEDQTTSKIILTDEDLLRGYVTSREVTSATLSVVPTVIVMNGREQVTTTCSEYTHTFDETFSIEAMVSLYDQGIVIYPSGITCGAEYIHITSSLLHDQPEMVWLDDVVNIWYSTDGEITYTMYLTNDNGDVLSNEVSITVDTSVTVPSFDYHFTALNPGDLGVTYNDDGTVNIYIQTDYTSDNEDAYYQITLGSIRYTSRDGVARIVNIPDESYPLRYDVCIDLDGICYSIYTVTPSGVANESYFYFDSTLTENTLSLTLYEGVAYVDRTAVRLVSSAGEEILLTEADFTYNEEYGEYYAFIEFSETPEFVDVYIMANPYYNGLPDIDSYIGSVVKIFNVTVYQP